LAARLYAGQQIAASIDRAGVRPFPLHNQPTDHFIKTIAVKQKSLEKWEPIVPSSTFTCPRDWMDSFLDSQISKLEERCVEIRAGMDAKLSEINWDPIWN
jgi:hypothetical protein